MALYESVIIGRQDLTPNQFEELIEEFIKIIVSYKGVIKKRENWGIRNLAYKINKNRKGHYILLNIDSSLPIPIFWDPCPGKTIKFILKPL